MDLNCKFDVFPQDIETCLVAVPVINHLMVRQLVIWSHHHPHQTVLHQDMEHLRDRIILYKVWVDIVCR